MASITDSRTLKKCAARSLANCKATLTPVPPPQRPPDVAGGAGKRLDTSRPIEVCVVTQIPILPAESGSLPRPPPIASRPRERRRDIPPALMKLADDRNSMRSGRCLTRGRTPRSRPPYPCLCGIPTCTSGSSRRGAAAWRPGAPLPRPPRSFVRRPSPAVLTGLCIRRQCNGRQC